jgi:Rieske Fe-S protein
MKKLMMMVAMMAVTLAMQAQAKFHDVELNEAKGAVKCIKSNQMGQDIVINFTPEGKMSQQGMSDAKYDADGYLQSAKMEMMGNQIDISYVWENGRVVGQKMVTGMGAIEAKRTFNDDGTTKANIMDMGGNQMEMPFTNYKFDEKGNWISRTTEMMGQTVEQTRTIEYYE